MSLSVTREIQAIIDMDLTVFGVNLSKILVSQRESIAELMQIRDKLKAEVAELQAMCKRKDTQYESLRSAYLAGNSPSPEPANACEGCGEQCDQDEEGENGEVNVEIKVTSNGPIPPELAAALNDLTAMLQSVARKK